MDEVAKRLKVTHLVTRLCPVFMFWCSGNDFHRYEPLLCEIRLYSRFSREPGTYDCDEHARMTGQMLDCNDSTWL